MDSASTAERRRRWRARAAAKVAKRRGDLVPEPCERCGTEERVQMHHVDYDRPLEVRWLCKPCHTEEHYDEDRPRYSRESRSRVG